MPSGVPGSNTRLMAAGLQGKSAPERCSASTSCSKIQPCCQIQERRERKPEERNKPDLGHLLKREREQGGFKAFQKNNPQLTARPPSRPVATPPPTHQRRNKAGRGDERRVPRSSAARRRRLHHPQATETPETRAESAPRNMFPPRLHAER